MSPHSDSSAEVCIVAAKRTPIGRFLGTLKDQSAVDLACAAGQAALVGLDPAQIDQVIVGNVIGSGLGMNVARQVGVRLGLPVSVPAYSVNMMCASGMQAVLLAAQAIRTGDARVVLCGGTESMSNAPYLLPRARRGLKFGDATLVDTLLCDGLVDAFDHRHMAFTAEGLAAKYGITRIEQDEFALRSQQRYEAARAAGRFADELVSSERLDRDEHARADTTRAGLAKLKPAFDPQGTVTAGNASGINDGAAMLVVAERDFARQRGWPVLAVIETGTTCGCDPKLMGLGPVHAIRKLIERDGLELSSLDTIEINEAFAAQALACLRELSLDETRLNPAGGAIAMGHPIGASGARLVTHLAHKLARGDGSRALASLCVGGGQGAAVLLRAAH